MPRRVVTGRTLYEDPRLTLSASALTMRGYAMPFGTARTLRIPEITRLVQHRREDKTFGTWPRWGRRNKVAWFPLEWSRRRRDVAVALWGAEGSCVVVTPANPGRFVALLVELGVPDESPPAEASG